MARWSDIIKHSTESFNDNKKYTTDDQMSIEALNNNIENSLYAIRVAENAQSATNNGVSYNEQTPTTSEQAQARTNINAVSKDASDLSDENVESWQNKLGVGKLIAEYTVSTASNTITISGLNIKPYEVYDVYLTGTISGGADVTMLINNASSGYKNVALNAYNGLSGPSVGSPSENFIPIGGMWSVANRIHVEIYNGGGIATVNSQCIGIDTTLQYFRNIDGCLPGLSSNSAITTLTFKCSDQTFAVGNKIKIFRRF